MRTVRRGRGLLSALLVTAFLAVSTDEGSAQTALTDGWSMIIYNGKPYYIPPGYTIKFVPLPDGTVLVIITPIPPPPPPRPSPPPGGGGGGGAVANQSVGSGHTYTQTQGESRTVQAGEPAWPASTIALKLEGRSGASPDVLFRSDQPFPRRALVPFIGRRVLDQFEADVVLIQSTLGRAMVGQQLNGRDFNRIRAAGLRIRDRLPSMIAHTDGASNVEEQRKALVALESVIASLEILLPFLEKAGQAST
jgi:hypothetical protein